MFKLAILICITISSASTCATTQSRIEFDSKSHQRTVCNVRFASIDGLTVTATRVPKSRWRSRVDTERFLACPYDVRLNYQGHSLRIDFSNAITQDMVTKFEPGMDVDTGFFKLDGENWVTNFELADSPANKIAVETSDRETSVTGIVQRLADQGQPAYLCFSVALIRKQGLVTGSLCSTNRAPVQIFSKLFAGQRVMSSE